MENNIVELLTNKHLSLGASESFSGGGFANYITNIPGASNVFKGSLVTYSNEMKNMLLKVNASTLDKFGAISKECVYEMVKNTKDIMGVDVAVAFSGNAGPGVSENKECGLIYIGFAYKDQILVEEHVIKKSRLEVKNWAIEYAINKIIDLIK